jgi:ABC-2 type transport system ATP-binding protein
METIQIQNLKKYYGNSRGVENVNFDLHPGEILGFIGPNGAGKSTVIRVLMGLISKTEGTVLVFGNQPSNITNEFIGYLPSEVFLYSELTVRRQLQYFARVRKIPQTRMLDLSEELDLSLDKKIRDLSFGNKKKVGIVAALMHEPKLLIFDEPTSGLDPLIQQKFFRILEAEKEKGTSILLSSHVLNEVEKVCSRICLIKEGATVLSDSLKSLKESQFRKITVSPALLDFSIPGLKILSERENETVYSYNGDINDLVRKFAQFHLDSLKIQEMDLEDIFMHYYEKEDCHD